MNFFATVIVLVAIFTLSEQQRSAPGRGHPCAQTAACVSAGPIADPNKYIAYQSADQYFIACADVHGVVFNMGCQVCSERDTYFSNECQDCLSRKDVNQKNCSDAGVIKPGAGNPAENPRNCPPPNSCNGRANGTYQLTGEPQSFYSCVGGEASECQDCPATLVYVEVCDQCLPQDTSNPDDCEVPVTGAPVTLCLSSFCDARNDGDYDKDLNTASNNYYACTEGSCIVKDCPPGTVFSQVCGECEIEYYTLGSECPVREVVTSAPPLPCAPGNFCKGKTDGSYSPPTENEAKPFFHICSFGECTVQDCPMGTRKFHPSGNGGGSCL